MSPTAARPPPNVFHAVEYIFPQHGKNGRVFPRPGTYSSLTWKTLAAVLFAAGSVRAALPEPPALPFPLPAADLQIRQTTTLFGPDQYLHLALLDRPLAGYELDGFSATLARRRWQSQVAATTRDLALLQNLRALAPSPEIRQPFTATLQLLGDGMKSWTLDEIQLLYTPGENASLCLSFPLPASARPAHAGTFTADLVLPLHDALFAQAAIQSDPSQTVRMETWRSRTPPDLFLDQAEPLLIAAGWTPPAPSVPPAVHPGNHSARARMLFLESILKNTFRVYHRGTSQLSILRTPDNDDAPGAPPHSYTFLLRTLHQWPATTSENLP